MTGLVMVVLLLLLMLLVLVVMVMVRASLAPAVRLAQAGLMGQTVASALIHFAV